jgi:hypothetical protein
MAYQQGNGENPGGCAIQKAAVTYDVLYLLLVSLLPREHWHLVAHGKAPSYMVSAGLLFAHVVAAAGRWRVGSFFQCIHIAF